jgi:hypothetical protein
LLCAALAALLLQRQCSMQGGVGLALSGQSQSRVQREEDCVHDPERITVQGGRRQMSGG